jgi:F420H(2)-dependent quinone reductase
MTTAYTKPSWAVRRVSAVLTRLVDLGVPLGSLRLLEGRRTIPVMLFRFGGHDWLVSIFGETRWVRALRASGVVRLRRGRRTETFTAVEADGQQSTAVVAQMRRQTRMNPLVRQALRAEHGHPVFRIEPR